MTPCKSLSEGGLCELCSTTHEYAERVATLEADRDALTLRLEQLTAAFRPIIQGDFSPGVLHAAGFAVTRYGAK